ncbi:MAG TPA: hypothetical protein VF774_17695 [Pseudoduganella sp.]|jgi:hypothetical protein
MTITRFATAAVAIGIPLALHWGQAHATTEYETAVLKAAAPHATYNGGAAVKVHRARLQGYFGGEEGNAKALAELKQGVQSCMKSLADSGTTLHPPSAWPDWVLIAREDRYTTANRMITYTSGTTHIVNNSDCSLLSKPYHRALLASAKGVCQIDLVRKTASGQCDAGGHADAPPTARGAAKPPADWMKGMAGNPALAASMKQVAGLAPVRGEQRTVQGVRCNNWTQTIAGKQTTLCYAIGGSFLPLRAVDNDGFGGLLLESSTPKGFELKAVDAGLDTTVGNDVFAPYARGGFAVNADKGEQ